MGKVYRAVLFDVHKVDLVPLLLQGSQRAADRGVLQRGGNDVFAVVTLQPGDALQRKIVGLAGTGCINDLRRLRIKAAGNALRGLVDGGFGGGTGLMAGVRVAGAAALHRTEAFQHGLVHRRVGRIVQIDHRSS